MHFTQALYRCTLHKHFIQALYTSALSKHFTQALYRCTVHKHFIQALYTRTLSKHFTQALYKHTLHEHFTQARYISTFIQALYTSTLSKHFTQPPYQSILHNHLIKALDTNTLSKHFIEVFLTHFRHTCQGITKVVRQGNKTRYYDKIVDDRLSHIFAHLTYRGEVLRSVNCFNVSWMCPPKFVFHCILIVTSWRCVCMVIAFGHVISAWWFFWLPSV